MPGSANSFVGGDGNVGGGYGTLRSPMQGDAQAGKVWPYVEITDREVEAILSDDTVEDERKAMAKKRHQYKASDHLGQLNYKPHAFVKSSTRGLTGIMASIEAEDVLEHLIKEVGYTAAYGAGGKSYDTMGSFDARTRPGRRTGSKRGWFSPHLPKPSDPENQERAYTLKDIGTHDEELPLKKVKTEKERVKRKNRVREMHNRFLKAYVKGVLKSM